MAGLVLDDWQSWVLGHAMGVQSDGQWSAFEVLLIVSRQCGKGSILEARQLAGLTILDEQLQVHTAHEFKTCYEHFLRMATLVEACPEVERQVARIRRGAGEQAIEMKNGNRLRFLARSSGSGRGMSGDAVYLDEAFALTPAMMGALLPTLSARENPQVWYTSSAPLASSGVLHSIRGRGIEGGSPRLFFAEWSVDEGTDPADVDGWYQAVPALGIRITEESVRAELEAMSANPEEFMRERLGVPDPPVGEARDPKLPPEAWARTVGPDRHIEPGRLTLAYGVSKDGGWSSIVASTGSLSDPYVEVVEHREGTGWLPGRLVELVQKWEPTAVGCNGAGPAGALVGPVLVAFQEAGIDANLLHQMSATEYKQACGGFFIDVVEGRLSRPAGQQPFDLAGEDATDRPLGDAWAWDLRRATVPICPLEAATIARALLPAEVPAYDVLASVL